MTGESAPIVVDRDADTPMSHQIFDQVRVAIVGGRLPAGTRLPATRRLAAELRISRTVVLDAYQRLFSEGFVHAKHGSGTTVAELPFGNQARQRQERPAVFLPTFTSVMPPEAEQAGRARYDFRPGLPSWDLFPRNEWGRTLSRVTRELTARDVAYGPAEGVLVLRAAIARHLRLTRGIEAEPSEIVITTGATQAIDVLARSTISAGDVVVVEDPCHPVLRQIFVNAGAVVVPVPVDEDGCRIDLIEDRLERYGVADRRVAVVYLTPAHQFPVGSTLSLARRIAAVDWARVHGAFLLEDDYDSELAAGTLPSSALAALDRSATVHVGSFSKTMFPGIRIGYAVLPPNLRERFLDMKWTSDRLTATTEQFALTRFMDSGRYGQHVRSMAQAYRVRRETLARALHAHFGAAVTITGAERGLHLLASIEGARPAKAVAERSLALGARIYNADELYLERRPANATFLLGYASMSAQDLWEGVDIVAIAAR